MAAERATEHPEGLTFFNWALVELIEAAVRNGTPERAADALQQLSEMTRASGTDWALGIEARSRALLSEGEARRDALSRGDRAARTHPRSWWSSPAPICSTANGCDASAAGSTRASSCAAPTRCSREFGMEAFAERARVELEATGEHARKRTVETRDDLTPQEAQISRLAAEGATNQEIAAQLFISPSTVDYHLRKAFRKLGVKSRTQLARHVLEPASRSNASTRDD